MYEQGKGTGSQRQHIQQIHPPVALIVVGRVTERDGAVIERHLKQLITIQSS